MTDSGRFRDATPEQLATVLAYLDTPLFSVYLLDAYLEWAEGKRAWSKGNQYAIEGFPHNRRVQIMLQNQNSGG